MSKSRNSQKRKGKNTSSRRKSSRQETEQHSTRQFYLKRILAFVKGNKDQAFTAKQIAGATGLFKQLNNRKIKSILDELADRGELKVLERGYFQYSGRAEFAEGQLQMTRSGVGFVLQEATDDIFINPSALGKAMHGDLVKVRLKRSRGRRGGSPEGEIVQVLHRTHTHIVGEVEQGSAGAFFLLADNDRINQDFFIPKEHLHGAKHGDKVLAELMNWDNRSPEVKVQSILGEAGAHHTEMHAILLQYGFNPQFPFEVEKEAEQIPEEIPAAEYKNRKDFRDILTFTIDPVDAKDFDDALSFRKLENGRFEVGVHIADVSYYVRPGSELDKEAFERATSVYLVDRTVPMLPEKLSNKVCSLRPHEEKLTYSAVFEMDAEAKIHDYWIGRTIIHSDHRFTYDGAQAIIEGEEHALFGEPLLTLNSLAKKLREARMKHGSIEFESNEVKFRLDEDGKPIGVMRKQMKDANRLIEDFMLLANRTVAHHLYSIKDNPPLPVVYRIHDEPNMEKLGNLQEFAKKFGYQSNLQARGAAASENLNDLLRQARGTAEQNVIETIAVRSMAKAIYSIDNIGHFGLGFEYYTHFTSPIRRYPDLMVHRLITTYSQGVFRENPTVLEEQCKHCSSRERTAAEAERASIKYKQVEFLEDKLGQRFSGVISGVSENGMWVELEENFCEGFVPMRGIEGDYYHYNEDTYALVGRSSGQVLRLGDRVEVEIALTDLKKKQVEMIFWEKLSSETPPVANP